MTHWLVKSEPDAWSWEQHWDKPGRVEAWSGVRNHQAKNNLAAMKKGDRAFFYHSVTGKEVVGLLEVVREAYPDPTDDTGKWVAVDMKAIQPAATPVTLKQIKAEPKLAEMVLVNNSRLSVQPVRPAEYRLVCKMAGLA
jgi:predicted RNA-binding protein with PUA-like domain